MSKQVLIWPSPWDCRLKNRIFESGFSLRGQFRRAYNLWRELALQRGIELNTYDMKPLDEADVLWFINMPLTKTEYLRTIQQAPQARTVLQVNESPVVAPLMFHSANQRLFDYVVSYDTNQCDEKRCFEYRLPFTVEFPQRNPSFQDRKVLAMINSNRIEGYFSMRQLGLTGLPGIGRVFSGWRFGFSDLLTPAKGELYGVRRDLARQADGFSEPVLDLFGGGWNGEQISWFDFYPNRPYRSFKKNLVEDKLNLLPNYRFTVAFENYRGSYGYIDVKLFDGFLAGTVPVYLGEERITDFVPKGSFVDARDFKNNRELLLYLKSCSESEWQTMREAGQDFLRSEKSQRFSDEAYAERMLQILGKILES